MRFGLLLFPVLLMCSGCSGLLWQNTDWDCKPAHNPNLRVFHAVQQKDWLVVYDELSERNKTVRTRAYFLYKNQQRVGMRKRPHFISLKTANGLPSVPVFESPAINTNSLTTFYVVTPADTASFTIYSNRVSTASYDLPWYSDPAGRAERLALSPAAVTVDVIIVGAVIYVIVSEEFQN